jgi:hypothetical protein
MFKIQKRESKGFGIFAISGRIEEEHLPDLQRLLQGEVTEADITIDLGEVTLAGREAVRFLAVSEAQGITLTNCPPYIRLWIKQGGGKP